MPNEIPDRTTSITPLPGALPLRETNTAGATLSPTAIAAGLQPAGRWSEARTTEPLIVLVLSPTTAVLTWRKPEGTPHKAPFTFASVWYLPAGYLYSAHWHLPVVLIPIAPPTLDPAVANLVVEPRLVRLDDLTRVDWEISQAVRKVSRWMNGAAAGPPASLNELGSRLVQAVYGPTAFYRTIGLSDERYHPITDQIENSLTLKKASSGYLAHESGKSLRHTARMFKLRTQLSLSEYVARRRCFHARERIEAGERLADVAAEVGFFDQPEMCKKFNAVFGCPPSTFAPRGPP